MSDSYWTKAIAGRVLNRRKAMALAGVGLSSAAILAACGGSGSKSSGSSAASSSGSSSSSSSGGSGALTNPKEGTFSPSSGNPTPGGRYKTSFNTGAENLNVVTQYNEGATLSGLYVYDRPLSSREDSRRYVLQAMASIETPDPLTVVMKIRPGSVFQNVAPVNGREVTADDYVATQDYEKSEPKAFDKTFVNSFLDKATATDKSTITMKLKRPNAYLFGGQQLGSGTGQPIIPKETIGPSLDTAVQIGSGPFQVTEARALNHYLYKQFPAYWGRKLNPALPLINEFESTYILDKSAQETAFYGGQLDYFVPSPEQLNTAKSRLPNAHFYGLPGFASTNISFNMWPDKALPWQKDERIREAIWHLTDRAEIAKRGYQGQADPTIGLVPTSLKPYQPDPKDVGQYTAVDPQKAKQLLDAAGYDYSKSWRIGTRAQGDVLESIALIQQTNMAKAGMKSQLQAYGSAFFDILGKKDWDFIVETPPGADTPGQQIRTQHSESWSPIYTGFALFDKTLDAMIEKSEEAIDANDNKKQVIDIQKYAMSHFSGSMEVVTHYALWILGEKVQNYELTLVPNAVRNEMWIKS